LAFGFLVSALNYHGVSVNADAIEIQTEIIHLST
jgi:hypothetical protein